MGVTRRALFCLLLTLQFEQIFGIIIDKRKGQGGYYVIAIIAWKFRSWKVLSNK